MQEHIVATFDTAGAAEAAANELEEAGIPTSAIRRYRASDSAARSEVSEPQTGGFWAWLLGEEDPAVTEVGRRDGEYFDGRGQGNVVLAVTIDDDAQIRRALEIIESHDPIEVEEETSESGSAAPATFVATNTQQSVADRAQEETIPLATEELQIGKRVVDRGTTRIRRYVVETPVEKEVTLHGERVTIERRTPRAHISGIGAFEERTVEVRETEEVPVVGKTTRVAEEVVVRREETERTEKVRDTVRREEIEITGSKSNTRPQ